MTQANRRLDSCRPEVILPLPSFTADSHSRASTKRKQIIAQLGESLAAGVWQVSDTIDTLPWEEHELRALSEPTLIGHASYLIMFEIGQKGFRAGELAAMKLEDRLAELSLYCDALTEYRETLSPWIQAGLELERALCILLDTTKLDPNGLATFWQTSTTVEQNLSIIEQPHIYCLFPAAAEVARHFLPQLRRRCTLVQSICLNSLATSPIDTNDTALLQNQLAVKQLLSIHRECGITSEDRNLLALPLISEDPPYLDTLPLLAGYFMTVSSIFGHETARAELSADVADFVEYMSTLERGVICALPIATAEQLPALFADIDRCIDNLGPPNYKWGEKWEQFLEIVIARQIERVRTLEHDISRQICGLATEEHHPDLRRQMQLANQYQILFALELPTRLSCTRSISAGDIPSLLECGAERESTAFITRVKELSADLKKRRWHIHERLSELRSVVDITHDSLSEIGNMVESIEQLSAALLARLESYVLVEYPQQIELWIDHLPPASLDRIGRQLAVTTNQFHDLHYHLEIEAVSARYWLRQQQVRLDLEHSQFVPEKAILDPVNELSLRLTRVNHLSQFIYSLDQQLRLKHNEAIAELCSDSSADDAAQVLHALDQELSHANTLGTQTSTVILEDMAPMCGYALAELSEEQRQATDSKTGLAPEATVVQAIESCLSALHSLDTSLLSARHWLLRQQLRIQLETSRIANQEGSSIEVVS